MGRGIWRRLRNEKGQSFVEFSLLVPMALVLILGVVDLGRGTSYWLDSSHLANEAARSAAVHGCPNDPITPGACDPNDPSSDGYVRAFVTAVKNQAQTSQLRADVTVCIWDLTGNSWMKGDEIHVSVSSLYNFLPFLDLASHTVTGRSSMRLETEWLPAKPTTNPYGVGPNLPCPGTPSNP
jgi:hypothetical protein